MSVQYLQLWRQRERRPGGSYLAYSSRSDQAKIASIVREIVPGKANWEDYARYWEKIGCEYAV